MSRRKEALACFLIAAQKMNMSARMVFGKGRLPPKHLSFILPQTDPSRKGGRPAGGKKRMFSFSIRCRAGIIRGRTKGSKPLKATCFFFFCCLGSLSFYIPESCLLIRNNCYYIFYKRKRTKVFAFETWLSEHSALLTTTADAE